MVVGRRKSSNIDGVIYAVVRLNAVVLELLLDELRSINAVLTDNYAVSTPGRGTAQSPCLAAIGTTSKAMLMRVAVPLNGRVRW